MTRRDISSVLDSSYVLIYLLLEMCATMKYIFSIFSLTNKFPSLPPYHQFYVLVTVLYMAQSVLLNSLSQSIGETLPNYKLLFFVSPQTKLTCQKSSPLLIHF